MDCSISGFPVHHKIPEHAQTSGGQSIGVSASASVPPMNIKDSFPLGLNGLITLQSKKLSKSLLTAQFKSINSSALSFLYGPTLTSIHDYWKNILWLDGPLSFVSEVISLLFNMLYMLVIALLPRSKSLLISWLQSLSAVILEPKKIKSLHCFHCYPFICLEVMGPDAMIFWMLSFSQLFHSSFSLS